MKHLILTIAVTLFSISLGVGVAAAKADFTGTWVLDKNKSDKLQEGAAPDETWVIRQSGDQIAVEIIVKTENGEQKARAFYNLDNLESKGKHAGIWSEDGNGFDVVEGMMFDGPNGIVNGRIATHWELSFDGATLTVTTTRSTPNGDRTTKQVFSKR